MSYAYTVTMTAGPTDGSGNATSYSEVVTGRVVMVKYTKVDFSNGVDFTITTEDTGQNLWVDTDVNATETVYPVLAGNLGGSGAASTLTEVPVYACNERIKVVIAQGGSTKTGTFRFVIA